MLALRRSEPPSARAQAIHDRCYRNRLIFARSMISSPRPLRTALIMNRLKPVICSSVIVGGMESSCRCTTTSTSMGPLCSRASLRNHRSYLLGEFRGEPQKTRGFRDLCEIRIVEIRREFEDAGGFHFQLDERQCIVLEGATTT